MYGASLDKEILSRPNRVLAEPYVLCDDNVETASSYMPTEGGIYTLEVFDALLTTQCAEPIEVHSNRKLTTNRTRSGNYRGVSKYTYYLSHSYRARGL